MYFFSFSLRFYLGQLCVVCNGGPRLTCRKASKEFTGPSYNLLTRNCNHFTSHLCQALTGQPAPVWINRAASIGVALPCVVPAGWIEPPECEIDDEGQGQNESSRLTGRNGGMQRLNMDREWALSDSESESDDEDLKGKQRQKEDVRDTQGRELPASERAPLSRTVDSGR